MGNFSLTKNYLADKALKAMYEVLKIGRMHKLSIKCLLDLFDKMIKPILLYGCEVWGFSDNDIPEKIYLKYCKILLNLKTSTPSYMVYGELGRYPIYIDIKIRTACYWARLIVDKQTKYSYIYTNGKKKLCILKIYIYFFMTGYLIFLLVMTS
jgi:hypothetical protein